MEKQKPLKAYLLEKCLISFGVINGIVNAVIFYAMHAADTSITFDFAGIVGDIAITTVVLGLILYLLVTPLTRKDVTADKFDIDEAAGFLGARLPQGKALSVVLATFIPALAITILVALCALLLPLPLTIIPMMIFKGFACAIAGAFAGYITVIRTATGMDSRLVGAAL
ncbi:MAG: hypothetical protein RR241_00890 [Raoultibacter sp.]